MTAYVCNCVEGTVPGQTGNVRLEFDPFPKNGMVWKTKGAAENSCRNFASVHLLTYKNFRVEKRTDGLFVVACDFDLAI